VVVNATTGACDVVGVVYAVAQSGATTYIGGTFTSVNGNSRPNVAAIRADGSLDPTWTPETNGIVYALAASSDGSKVFIGGGFTTVNGELRSRLAAVDAVTGDLVPGWTTQVNNNNVRALAADGNDRLYVGGNFGRLGGRDIPRLGAVSQSTGAVQTAFVPRPTGTVRALGLTDDGTHLYLGGPFTTLQGQSRPGVAEVNPLTGVVTSFAPTDGGVPISMDVSPGGLLFFGTTNNRTWAYNPTQSNTPLYRVRTSGDVQAIAATDTEVYIGGHFSGLPEEKLNRAHIASFFTATGTGTSWNPGVNGSFGVWALLATPTALQVGGDFTRAATLARRGVARFNFS
jgi:hypothetical protein